MRGLRRAVLISAGCFCLMSGCNRRTEPPQQTLDEPAPNPTRATPKPTVEAEPAHRPTPTRRVEPHRPAVLEKELHSVSEQAPGPSPATGPDQSILTQRPVSTAETKASRDSALPHKKHAADDLFDKPSLLRIQLQIAPAGLDSLRQTRGDRHGDRPVAMATVREGDRIYTNVTVHLKGSVGSFRSIDAKPAMTLNFDKAVPGQSFHGLHKISLNNSVQDSSYLSEKIARELFIAAGVPAPRASHATVELNGRPLGLYVLVEGANRQFLKRYFDNPDGNLYDGGFCRDISSRLSINCGENQNDHSGLKALRAAVRDGRYSQLEKALDMDRFISMVALEIMLGHWDGYTLSKNNWRVFHDLGSNRMVFIPHGLDQLFGSGRQFDPNGAILPRQVQGEVARAVLDTPEGRRAYLSKVASVYTNVFKAGEIVSRIDEIVAGVAPALAQTDAQAARRFQQRANALKQRIMRRDAGLRQQLRIPFHTNPFGSDGILALTGWTESAAQSGDPVLSQVQDPNGKEILVINTGSGPSSSSWRTRVALAPGRYQFEGRLRVNGVTIANGDQRGGAGMRVSKGSMPHKVTGTSDWQEYNYPFDVSDPGGEVELICELKANAGEAKFDASSLRLIKLQ